MSEKTIMVVDDNRDIVQVLAEKFRIHGYEVVEAYDGVEAIKKISLEKPDLILLDIMMPGMDGNELFQKLRENKSVADIPVIFITALKTPSDDGRQGELVAGHVMFPKPYDFSRLLAAVRAMI